MLQFPMLGTHGSLRDAASILLVARRLYVETAYATTPQRCLDRAGKISCAAWAPILAAFCRFAVCSVLLEISGKSAGAERFDYFSHALRLVAPDDEDRVAALDDD